MSAGEATMQYVIDGYNLLHQVGLLSGTVNPAGLQRARQTLLEHLVQRLGKRAFAVTVVFDATAGSRLAGVSESHEGITVLFTGGEEADDLIETLIRQAAAPKSLTVVSNDHRLRKAAERRGCPVCECVDFWDSVGKEAKRSAEEDEAPDKPATSTNTAEWLRAFSEPKAPSRGRPPKRRRD